MPLDAYKIEEDKKGKRKPLSKLKDFDLRDLNQGADSREKSITARTRSGYDMQSDALAEALHLIEQQEYMLKRQRELLDAGIKRNNEIMAACNSFSKENEKLKKELSIFKMGGLRAFVYSFLESQAACYKHLHK